MLVFPHFVRALLQLRTYLSCLFVHFVVVVVFYFFFSPFFFFLFNEPLCCLETST